MKKIISTPIIFLIILIGCLMLAHLIPTSLMKENMEESIIHYDKNRNKSYLDGARLAMNDSSADSTALNVMYNTSRSKRILYSTLIVPAYRDLNTQDFTTTAYNTIINNKEANYDYNRYWHGYQILWKPLLVLFNVNTIRQITLVAYLCLLVYTIHSCIKLNNTKLGIALGTLNLMYIVPFGFTALEYISVFFIMMISSLLLLKSRINPLIILTCSGIAAAFFDFLTSETLTLTIPLLTYLYLQRKNPKFLEFVKLGIGWIAGYCGTFLTKWGLSTLIYKKNYFKIAFDKYETHTSPFDAATSIKSNISILFGDKLSFNEAFKLFIILLVIIIITIYLLRKESTSPKYLVFMLMICLIPYVRYIVIKDHSWGFAWFTYRAQLVIIPILVLALSEVDLSIFKKQKKGGKFGGNTIK